MYPGTLFVQLIQSAYQMSRFRFINRSVIDLKYELQVQDKERCMQTAIHSLSRAGYG